MSHAIRGLDGQNPLRLRGGGAPGGRDGGGYLSSSGQIESLLHHSPAANVPPPGFGEELFVLASALIGTRFRLHGRDAVTGLDCIGLVVAAYRQAGVEIALALEDYPLRGLTLPDIINAFTASGLTLCPGRPRTGDIALIACGHGQYHVALLGPDSHIHAHAGLRRVVETPGWPDGVVGVFHLKALPLAPPLRRGGCAPEGRDGGVMPSR